MPYKDPDDQRKRAYSEYRREHYVQDPEYSKAYREANKERIAEQAKARRIKKKMNSQISESDEAWMKKYEQKEKRLAEEKNIRRMMKKPRAPPIDSFILRVMELDKMDAAKEESAEKEAKRNAKAEQKRLKREWIEKENQKMCELREERKRKIEEKLEREYSKKLNGM